MSKLIKIKGKFYKECGVIMVETTKVENSLKGYLDTSLLFKYQKEYKTISAEKGFTKHFHLYITSDDEIKDGDWVLDKLWDHSFEVKQWKGKEKFCIDLQGKIIATTDTTLKIPHNHKELPDWNLPQPSESFIQAFVVSNNIGEKIKKVLVEYNKRGSVDFWYEYEKWKMKGLGNNPDDFAYEDAPKLKDNNIIIKKVKDSWTREEVHSLMMQAWINGEANPNQHYTVREKWIEENL